ncbi:MAG: YihY/virulence factor BrkB family protein [bacterium]|nr:YihY/virulence factor BrkB family protein [bacterium]
MFSLVTKALRGMVLDKTHRLGAALSYYAIFSLVPLLILSLSIASFVLPQSASQDQLLRQVSVFFGDPVANLVASAIYSIQGSDQGVLATVLVLLILVFGAGGVFRQLKDALNTIWKVDEKSKKDRPSIVAKNIVAVLTIFFTGLLLIVWTLLNLISSYLKGTIFSPQLSLVFWQTVNFAGTLLVGTILVATIFAVFPDKRLKISDMLFPAFITVILFTLLRFVFSVYLDLWQVGSAYGAAGTVVVFLIWIYLAAQVLLFGAELSRVYTLEGKKG